MATLEELLKEHSKQVGIPLVLDAAGVCHLVVNGSLGVHIEKGEQESYFLYSHLGNIPNLGNEAVFGELLKANLYGKRTQSAVFALDAVGTRIVLFREVLLPSVDFASYLQIFQEFVNQVAYWKKELERLGVQESKT